MPQVQILYHPQKSLAHVSEISRLRSRDAGQILYHPQKSLAHVSETSRLRSRDAGQIQYRPLTLA